MFPILFAPNATSFNTNGIGRLIDTVSCKVIEERNGQYELEMTYPNTGRLFSQIQYSSIIVVKPFQNGTLQAFRVYKISKAMKGLVTVYARHISYQLNYIPCSEFSGQSCSQVMSNITTATAEYCPFTFTTDITENRTSVSENLIASLDDAVDAENTAENYSNQRTYKVGQYCRNLNRIWQCTYPITIPENWNANHWTTSTIPMVGILSCVLDSSARLVEDENAVCVWVKCEKSKRYSVSKILSGCFGLGCLTQIPSEGKVVSRYVSVPNQRKYEYTTTADAEYLVFYVYRQSIDGADRYESIMNSLSIRAIGTYSWILYEPKTIRTFLLGEDDNSIQAIYGGEYEWDNYSVKLWENRGSNKGVKLRYGKNLIDLTQEENIENTITGIYPIWKSEGTVVELPEKVIHAANAGNYPYLRTVIQDFTSEFESMPTVEDLREYANLYIEQEGIGVPEVSITVNFVNLADTMEYSGIESLQSVNLCDIVTVEFPELGVQTEQKVSKTEYDVLNERYLSITVGNLDKTLDMTLEDQMNELSQKVTEEEAQNQVDRATGVMNAGTRGHVIIGRNDDGFANEIFFLDNANVALAKNVLRVNVNGIGFSSNGLRGPYYQAWTLDGHLSLGGINNANGTLEILDSSGNVIGRWDNNGINSYKGTIRGTSFHSSNDEFYVEENGEDGVEVGWSGWDVWNRTMKSQTIGWDSNNHVNPASGDSSAAALNGGPNSDYSDSGDDGYGGTAGFKALWLDDSWYEGGASSYSYTNYGRSNHHLWDITEVLRWLEGRITYLERHPSCRSDDDDCPHDGCIPEEAECIPEGDCGCYGCNSEGGCPCDGDIEDDCGGCYGACDSEYCGSGGW